MDVLNKLYCSVSSTVSQFSTVLPGNPVTREYEATNHIGSAGPGLLWKIFSGYKKSTNQEASIFLLEKKQLDRLSKNDREAVLDVLRKGISQLSRLRHPQVLIVQHTLEESRDSLAFATEPVFTSLANILGKVDNVPVPVPKQLDNYNLFEVEIKYGLLQVAEGLSFLHNDVKLLHRNVCPNNIIINKEGAWKIFGFDHSIHCISGADATVRWPSCEYAIDVHAFAQPDLDYIAPESALSGTTSAFSDIFSMGVLIYSIFNKGQPLYYSNSNLNTFNSNVAAKVKTLSNSDLRSIPQAIRDFVKLMLNYVPELRPEIHDFLKSEFFDDIGVKALSYLDSLFQWDNLQKSQFYKGLPTVIEKLPHRVAVFRIVPCLAKEFVNATMVPFVLPSVFAISEGCSKNEFSQCILPYLRPVLKLHEPIQILLICMQKMELMLKLTPADDIKSDILPMLFRSLECDSQQLQELCLSVIPTFATLIDYPAMKNALMPRIKKLCINTNHTSVRVNCLVCIGKLMEYLDKWLILDDIIPFLPYIKSTEPAVLMSIVGIYKMVLTHKKITIPKEVMAGQILPFLIPLSIENSLTLNQFNTVMAVVKEMVTTVENEHRAKLEQLNSIQEQQKALNLNAAFTNGLDAGNSIITSTTKSNDDLQELFQPKSDNKPFSFQEKQTLSKQNELEKRLQMEPAIAATPAAKTIRSPNTPKDLTASLIDNNLKEMKLTSTTTKSMPLNLQSHCHQTIRTAAAGQSSMNSFTQPAFSAAAYSSPMVQMNNNLPPASFTSNAAQLSPAAFFANNAPAMPTLTASQSRQPTKQLTFSEIDDFLN